MVFFEGRVRDRVGEGLVKDLKNVPNLNGFVIF